MADASRLIVVCGATGRQGGAVARRLLADGVRVRALTRKPEGAKARALAALGAEVVGADMAEPRSLRQALDGAHGVFSVQNPMLSGLQGEVAQGKNVADAARATGVEHVVYGSAGIGRRTGVGSWDTKVEVEAYLRELGLRVTVLRPMAFMDLMTDKGFYPPVSTWHLMPKLMGAARRLPWIAAEDVGAVAAKAFAAPDAFAGRTVQLAADVRSLDECRSTWRELRGRPPRRFPMPVALFHRFVGDDPTTMWRWLRTGEVPLDTEETLELHPDALTVRDFLAREARKEAGWSMNGSPGSNGG